MIDAKRTGRTRHRSEIKWGRERLILQVEVEGIETTCIGGVVDSEHVRRWRDARTSDLTVEPTING